MRTEGNLLWCAATEVEENRSRTSEQYPFVQMSSNLIPAIVRRRLNQPYWDLNMHQNQVATNVLGNKQSHRCKSFQLGQYIHYCLFILYCFKWNECWVAVRSCEKLLMLKKRFLELLFGYTMFLILEHRIPITNSSY